MIAKSKSIVKKYWKQYLEELWYLSLIYGFVVFMDWYTGFGLDLFRPVLIVAYMFGAGLLAWLHNSAKTH